MSIIRVMGDVASERTRQVKRWGEQHRPDFSRSLLTTFERKREEMLARAVCDAEEKLGPSVDFTGGASWESVLREECAEAYSQTSDKVALRKELIQCAAVICAWIEDLDNHT